MDAERPRRGGAGARLKTPGELRRFGFIMAGCLAVVAALLLWRHRTAWPYFASAASVFALVALAAPRVLRPLERAWMKLAGWMSALTTTVTLTFAYFLIVTPLGLVRRVLHRDPLKLRFDPHAGSYWEPVDPAGPTGRADRPY
jgi:hypothetical protein